MPNLSGLGGPRVRPNKKRSVSGARTAALVIIIALGALSAACGNLSVGSGDFSCKGLPDGKNCKSARQNYEATNGSEPVLPYHDKRSTTGSGGNGDKRGNSGSADGITVHTTTAVLPTYDRPYPIRTPARVMRVWFAPYEDDDGALHDGGFVFAEVQARRWAIGDAQQEEPTNFFPLQSVSPGDEGKKTGAGNAQQSAPGERSEKPGTKSRGKG